jgi:hypothetical protein
MTILESSFTKAGITFGGIGGGAFDDSLTNNFTCTHYLRGMVARHGFFQSDWYQFLYSSPYHPDTIMEADVHGTRSEKDIPERFLLGNDEKVFKVQVVCYNVSYYINNILTTELMVRGIRLFTTKGRASPSIDYGEGVTVAEQFDGYVVAYARGRSGLAIDQLQFHWQRTVAD